METYEWERENACVCMCVCALSGLQQKGLSESLTRCPGSRRPDLYSYSGVTFSMCSLSNSFCSGSA